MALHFNTLYAIPRLHSYEDADRRERDTKPIRGDKNNLKPLGKRSQKWRHIKREADNSIAIYDGHDDWAMCFYPNGELHIYNLGYWNKASYNEVITEVTGMPVHTEQGHAWIRYDGGIVPLAERKRAGWVPGKGWVRPDGVENPPTVFVKNERGRWTCYNAPLLYTLAVSRKGAKAVRQRYAEGLGYVDALAKLRRDEVVNFDEVVAAFRDTRLAKYSDEDLKRHWAIRDGLPPVNHHQFTHAHAADLAALLASEDPGDQYKAFLWLQHGCGLAHTMPNANRVLMMHHHDEWFVKREVPIGQKALNRYDWAIPLQN